MRSIYRFTGLLATLSLLATFLVTSGFVCGGTSGGGHNAHMSGMDMSTMSAGQSAGETHLGAAESGELPVSCDTPMAPDECLSMAPCAPVALTVPHVTLPEISVAVFRVSSTSVLQPPSETTAPELPPPRV